MQRFSKKKSGSSKTVFMVGDLNFNSFDYENNQAPPSRHTHTFLLSNHFLFSAKKYLYASKRNQDKPLCRKRVYSKHKSIQSLRMPKFRVLIKNAEVCFENWNHPLQTNLKPRFTERKSREDENKKSWRLMCLRKKIFTR